MSVYGRVHAIIMKLKEDNDGKDPDLQDVFRELKEHGLGTLNERQMMDLITFRAVLSEKVSGAFMAMQFNCVGGLIRVSSADFASLTKLDKRAQWAKVCILLYHYLQTKKSHPCFSITRTTRRKVVVGLEKAPSQPSQRWTSSQAAQLSRPNNWERASPSSSAKS